jgi:hypothetical protein
MPAKKGVSFIELVFVLNLYANLLFSLGAILWTASFLALGRIPIVFRLLIASAFSVTPIVYGVIITSRLPRKKRIANLLLSKLETRAFDPSIFRLYLGDPCMVLLSRYVLIKMGSIDRYREIVEYAKECPTLALTTNDPELQRLINEGILSEASILQSLDREASGTPN